MIIQGVKLSSVLANLRRQQIKYALLFCNMLLHSLNRWLKPWQIKKITCWGNTKSVLKDLSCVDDSSVDQLCVLHFHNCSFLVECKKTYRFLCRFCGCGTDLLLEPPLIRTIFRFSWEFELAGFCFLICLSYGCIFIKVRCSHGAAVQGERKLTSTLHVSCYLRIFINLVSFGSVLCKWILFASQTSYLTGFLASTVDWNEQGYFIQFKLILLIVILN